MGPDLRAGRAEVAKRWERPPDPLPLPARRVGRCTARNAGRAEGTGIAMLGYTLRRLGFVVVTVLITSMIVFAIAQLLPGDVARVMLGREASADAVNAMRVKLGLNDPVLVRYVRWLGDFVQGKWGATYPDNAEIFPLVMQRLVKSLWLAIVTLVMAVPLAIALGVVSGLNANKPVDGVISI